jgi:hypothetical protein
VRFDDDPSPLAQQRGEIGHLFQDPRIDAPRVRRESRLAPIVPRGGLRGAQQPGQIPVDGIARIELAVLERFDEAAPVPPEGKAQDPDGLSVPVGNDGDPL